MQVLSSYHSAVASTNLDVQRQPLDSSVASGTSMPGTSVSEGSSRTLVAEYVPPPPPEPTEEASSLSSLKYHRSERTTLYMQTREGDVVRLKFKSRDAIRLSSTQVPGEEADVSEISLKTLSSTKLSVKVKGDLNEDELAAIQSTIEQASALADDFFAGDLNAAFESVAALEVDGSQLARVKLNMRAKEHLTYTARGLASAPLIPRMIEEAQGAAVRSASGEELGAGPAPPTDSVPSDVEVTAVDDTVDPVANDGDAAMSEAGGQAEAVDQAVPIAQSTADAFRSIGDFLTRLMDAFRAEHDGTVSGSLDVSLKLRLFESALVTLSEVHAQAETGTEADAAGEAADEAEVALSPLVHDTIDALAAQEQPPVDKVA